MVQKLAARDARRPTGQATDSRRRSAYAPEGRLAQLAQALNASPRAQSLMPSGAGAQGGHAPVAASSNRTGLPDRLKAGVEHMSGISLDDVRVHYNSARPAQLSALAYAQGTDIHLAPGQERHLPHEAWHVVQQAQGRVRSTAQLANGLALNDDHGLEGEADRMGRRAAAHIHGERPADRRIQRKARANARAAIQRATEVKYSTQHISYADGMGQKHGEYVGKTADAWIDIADPVQGSGPDSQNQQKAMYDRLAKVYNVTAFIRGHLFNDHLGGVGEAYNLFPITYNANSEHKVTAEGHLKKHARTEMEASEKKLKGPYFVRYRVTAVAANPGDLTANADAEFQCEMVSGHDNLPGGKSETWTIYSKPGSKTEAQGARSSKKDYSNDNLGEFGATGKGENSDTKASRTRSTVDGWGGNPDHKFAKGHDISGHVSLSAFKEAALAKLENAIDAEIAKDRVYEPILFEALEKAGELFGNAHDEAAVTAAYQTVWENVLSFGCEEKKRELLKILHAHLTPLGIADSAKEDIYYKVRDHIAPITDMATLIQQTDPLSAWVEEQVNELQA